MPIDALSVLCAQLTRDLLAIAKFLFTGGKTGYRGRMRGSQEALHLERIQIPKIKTAAPGMRIGGRSQYNRPTFCFICCRSTTI